MITNVCVYKSIKNASELFQIVNGNVIVSLTSSCNCELMDCELMYMKAQAFVKYVISILKHTDYDLCS